MHEFTRPQPAQTRQSRPSTSMGIELIKQRQNQVWSDAARIAALTGGNHSVDTIKNVLDKMRPQTSDPVRYLQETPYDQMRPASRAGSSLSRDFNAQKKPGGLPRDISADEARQMMANKSQSMVQRGPAVQECSPHQPKGPVARPLHSGAKQLKPLRTVPTQAPASLFVSRAPPQALGGKEARFQGGSHAGMQEGVMGNSSVYGASKPKPKTSSLFLMSAGPGKSKGLHGVQAASAHNQKPSIGIENSRMVGGRLSQSLTLPTPSFDATF